MEYNKLVAVTGMPGLYELLNSKGDGAIVRSLEDNSTKFASSRIHNFSHLESIEIYTTGENVNLVEIFYAMEKAGGSTPDGKDNGVLIKYFEKVYPDLDFERVYPSDLKKMVKWYDILKKNKIEIKLSEPVEEEEEVEEPVREVESIKVDRKKEAPKKAKEEEKPAKKEEKKEAAKPAAKKAAEKEEKPAAKKKAAPKDTKEKKSEKKETPAKKKAAPKKK